MSQKNEKNSNIQRDITLLKSFVIGLAGRDKEGSYKPQFVERVLKASQNTPVSRFKGAKSFLKHLQS